LVEQKIERIIEIQKEHETLNGKEVKTQEEEQKENHDEGYNNVK